MIKEDVFTETTQAIETNYYNGNDYQTERNKPMPNRIHGRIQSNTTIQLALNGGDKFTFESEVTLDTHPKSSTPDICIFPKKRLRLKDIEAKSTEMPLSTIEIQSPSQAPEELVQKAWESYFPAGVKSAWVIIPALKAVRIILPDNQNFVYMNGDVLDPTNGISIPVDKIFEGIDL